MNTRKDCLHYHEEPYMGARVECCLAETAFGVCPCTPDCKNYIPRDSSVRIVRCKDCKHNANPSEAGNADCDLFYGMTEQYGFCHRAERRTDG